MYKTIAKVREAKIKIQSEIVQGWTTQTAQKLAKKMNFQIIDN